MNIGLLGALGVVFTTLKLTELIDWSWWLVLMPFYIIPAGLVAWIVVFWIVALITLAVAIMIETFKEYKGKNNG